MNNKILITGASGHLGGGVLDHLLTMVPASQLIAAGRGMEPMARFAAQGVITRHVDFDDPASVERVLENVGTLYLVPTAAPNRLEQHQRVIDTAKATGVQHVLYSGVIHHDETGFGAAVSDHQALERYILSSGLPHTFVRNSIYLDVMPLFLGNAVESGVFALPVSPSGVSWASRADLAEATARIIANPAMQGRVHALSLPQAVDYAAVAATVSKISGRPVSHVDLSVDAYEQVLVQVGLPAGQANFLAGLANAMAKGVIHEPNSGLADLLGRAPESMEHYLQNALQGAPVQ
jgi:NAD(P)H dehydrogenase (quinone)